MITKLLDGLEMFFNVYEVSQVSSKLQMTGGAHIYIDHTLELAVWSRWQNSAWPSELLVKGVGTSGHSQQLK